MTGSPSLPPADDDPLGPLRSLVASPLPHVGRVWIAGVLGSHPSTYSLSPVLWNAAFAALNLPVTYLAFDVNPDQVDAFFAACRAARSLLGLSVTVPYKTHAVRHLDRTDALVRHTGAANVVARTADGGLEGTNTDAPAVARALGGLAQDGREIRRVLVVGGGGAAHAAGVGVSRRWPRVEVLIQNRTQTRAVEVAARARALGHTAAAVDEGGLDNAISSVDAVINATSVGMTGPIQTGTGVAWLEAFSPLAPADAPSVEIGSGADLDRQAAASALWREEAWPAITRNLEASLRRMLRLPTDALALDLVYAPPETVFLKHARWTGHRAANGLGVLVEQAVDAFLLVARPLLRESPEEAQRVVREAMWRAAGGGIATTS